MSELVPAKANRPVAMNAPENLPKLGEWYWVRYNDQWNEKDRDQLLEHLACVSHVASNHVVFAWSEEDRSSSQTVRMPFDELPEYSRPEPKWREVLNGQIAEKQKELQDAVRALADTVRNAGLISDVQAAPTSMLPSVTRNSPEEHKTRLLELKKTGLPQAQENIQTIIKQMVALQKDLCLPERSMADRLIEATGKIDDRLFALEIYAGLWEKIEQIADGAPAPMDTPITVRQLMLFMDEECLIDYEDGGMDYSKLSQFDKWIAKKENRDRLIPEPRCIVAFRVRRSDKDYGPLQSFAEIFVRMEEHFANMQTYLLMRNGDKLFRLATDVDFKPRLLPLRQEFHQPFEKTHKHYGWAGKPDTYQTEKITPDHLDYDEHVEERAKQMAHYNRVLFLIQGLLDRSEVFRPHPPINLMDNQAAQQWFVPKHDEEDGLPSANPPVWEAYRDAHNSKLKPGDFVFAKWMEEVRYYRRGDYEREVERQGVSEVTQIKRDRSMVRISWPAPDREGYEHPTGWGRGYGKWGRWPTNRKVHRWVKITDCFNIATYRMGDYKLFLCDAYLKGRYLEWAPQLLSAEKWHQQKRDPKWTATKKRNESKNED